MYLCMLMDPLVTIYSCFSWIYGIIHVCRADDDGVYISSNDAMRFATVYIE